MAFKYTPIQDTDYVKEVSHTVNSVGSYLQSMSEERDTLPYYNQLVVTDSPSVLQTNTVYYLTQIQGLPSKFGASANGYGILLRRNPSANYYTFVFQPYNSTVSYYKISLNGVWQDWQSDLTTENTTNYQKYSFTDEKGQVSSNKSIDVSNTSGYSKSKGTLVNAPTGDAKGWIDFSDTVNGDESQTVFNPTEGGSFYTKQKKQKVVAQNPNIIQDSLFTTPIPNTYVFNNDSAYWGTGKGLGRVIQHALKFKGQNVVEINDSTASTYPTMRGRALEVGEGKTLQAGKVYTFSAYVMTPDVSAIKENRPYIEVAYPDSVSSQTNPTDNSVFTITGLRNNEWKRVSVTFTVPASATYARPNMRLNTTPSGTGNGALLYYALPKLEEGSTVTPFITHPQDKKQFDEIWSNWNEYLNKEQLENYSPVDVTGIPGYFKYYLTTKHLTDLGIDFYDYVGTMKKGFHTFYLQNGAPGTPFDGSVRGTILIDYNNDGHGKDEITSPEKYATIDCTSYNGVHYSVYYQYSSTPKQRIRQSTMETKLYEGTWDLAQGKTITLSDDYTNYTAMDVVVYFASSAVNRTIRVYPSIASASLRDFNLGNNNSDGFFTLYEGSFNYVDSKTLIADFAKKVFVKTSEGKEYVTWNETGNVVISKIIGVHTA